MVLAVGREYQDIQALAVHLDSAGSVYQDSAVYQGNRASVELERQDSAVGQEQKESAVGRATVDYRDSAESVHQDTAECRVLVDTLEAVYRGSAGSQEQADIQV